MITTTINKVSYCLQILWSGSATNPISTQLTLSQMNGLTVRKYCTSFNYVEMNSLSLTLNYNAANRTCTFKILNFQQIPIL